MADVKRERERWMYDVYMRERGGGRKSRKEGRGAVKKRIREKHREE